MAELTLPIADQNFLQFYERLSDDTKLAYRIDEKRLHNGTNDFSITELEKLSHDLNVAPITILTMREFNNVWPQGTGIKEIFAANLYTYTKDYGFEAEDVAAALSLNDRMYKNYFSGERAATVHDLIQLHDILDCSYEELLAPNGDNLARFRQTRKTKFKEVKSNGKKLSNRGRSKTRTR